MILYLIILFFLLAIFLLLKPKWKYNKYIYVLIGVILAFTAGLRPEDATNDYMGYLKAYYTINDYSSRLEPTFYIIVSFVKVVFSNPVFLFIIYAILGVSLKFIAIKQISELYLLSALIYFTSFFLLHEMTQIRAGVASGILLLCIKPLYQRNLKKFIILVALSISFHYSALVFLLLWFLNPKNIDRKFYLSLIPIVYILALKGFTLGFIIEHIPIDPIQTLYSMYKINMEKGLGDKINLFNGVQLLHCAMALFLIYNVDKLKKQNEYAPILLKIYTLSIIIFVMFSDFPVISFRISELLGIVEIILIPFLLYLFKPKRLAILFPIGIALLMFMLNLFYVKLIL